MPNKQIVDCPYCRTEITLDVPPRDDVVVCHKCGEKSDWWADGDIGPVAQYYLVRCLPSGRPSHTRQVSQEQKARDMLERAGVDRAQEMTAGDLVELANLISDSEDMEHMGVANPDEAYKKGYANGIAFERRRIAGLLGVAK